MIAVWDLHLEFRSFCLSFCNCYYLSIQILGQVEATLLVGVVAVVPSGLT